jgi:hypothetical protein
MSGGDMATCLRDIMATLPTARRGKIEAAAVRRIAVLQAQRKARKRVVSPKRANHRQR